MTQIHIDPKTPNRIVVHTSGNNAASNSMSRVSVEIISAADGTMALKFDFPQVCKGRKEARNVITVYDDGSMVAEKCVPEAI